ncbi:MAG: hypothetical protein U1F36_22585 [Planctomycetota bacterium]
MSIHRRSLTAEIVHHLIQLDAGGEECCCHLAGMTHAMRQTSADGQRRSR